MDIFDLSDDLNEKINTWEWTETYRYIKGKPWSFGNRTYLKDIYNDTSRDTIFVKGRQVEASELSINKVLHFLTTHPYTKCLYTFPTKDLCEKFGGERFHEAFIQSPKLLETILDNGSVYTKKFRNHSYLYLQTASSGGDKARSISSDLLVCDEYQDFEGGDIELDTTPARDALMENLSHSEYKKTITLGTPKLLDSHFEQIWKDSSQNFWHVICDNCKHIQTLSVSNIINFEKAFENDEPNIVYYGCELCKTPLDRSVGFWKPTHPMEKWALTGYHLSQLLVPWIPAEEIMRKHGTKHLKGKVTSIRAFNNEVLGLFYSGSAQPFSESVLQMCYKPDETLWDAYFGADGTFMGVDWGDITTVCIIKYDSKLDLPQIVYAEKFKHPHLNDQWPEVAKLVKRFNVRRVVCDIGYGKSHNQELQRQFPGRVWHSNYTQSKIQSETYVFDQKDMKINVDRDNAIRDLAERAERGCHAPGGLIIPYDFKAASYLRPFIDEMKRVVAQQQDNRTTYKRIGGDHFTHSLLYAIVAAKGESKTTKHRVRTSIVRSSRR